MLNAIVTETTADRVAVEIGDAIAAVEEGAPFVEL